MTNEEYIKAINMRRSRRTYKNKLPDEETRAAVKEMMEHVNKTAGLNMIFIDDASFAFTFFTGKFSAIAVCGNDKIKTREDCGYYGETIVLQCVYHGLATCWVTSAFKEDKMLERLNLPMGIRLYALILVGLAKPEMSRKEKSMYNTFHKKNKPYQRMFEVCDRKIPDYMANAMKLVEMAPSDVNRRPVKFYYEDDVLSASVDEPYSDKSVELGIVKLHYQLGCSAQGIKGEWIDNQFIIDGQRIIKFPKAKQEVEGNTADTPALEGEVTETGEANEAESTEAETPETSEAETAENEEETAEAENTEAEASAKTENETNDAEAEEETAPTSENE